MSQRRNMMEAKNQQDRTSEILQRTTIKDLWRRKNCLLFNAITGQLSSNHDENCQKVCH